MLDVHPAAELAPRDVVARGIAVEMAAQGGAPVLLDATGLGAGFLARRFPTIDAACRRAGLDWSRVPIPVTPAAHYWMGGVATDTRGRSTVPGLYAVGEVACTGAHGANRLASNSLLESIVFAHRAARDLAGGVPEEWEWRSERGEAGRRDVRASVAEPEAAGAVTVVDRTQLQQLMWAAAGVHRSREGLENAGTTLAGWRASESANPTRHEREDANLLQLARILVSSALAREESRGAHFRSDFPGPSDEFARQLVRAREVTVPC